MNLRKIQDTIIKIVKNEFQAIVEDSELCEVSCETYECGLMLTLDRGAKYCDIDKDWENEIQDMVDADFVRLSEKYRPLLRKIELYLGSDKVEKFLKKENKKKEIFAYFEIDSKKGWFQLIVAFK